MTHGQAHACQQHVHVTERHVAHPLNSALMVIERPQCASSLLCALTVNEAPLGGCQLREDLDAQPVVGVGCQVEAPGVGCIIRHVDNVGVEDACDVAGCAVP